MKNTKELMDEQIMHIRALSPLASSVTSLFFINEECLGLLNHNNEFLGVVTFGNGEDIRLSFIGTPHAKYLPSGAREGLVDLMTKLQMEFMFHLHRSVISQVSPTYNSAIKLTPKDD